MDILIFFFYVISLIVMADAKLKEFPSGQKFLTGLEGGAVSILRWRAEADANLDMIGIKRFLLLSTAIFFISAFFMMANGVKPNIYFSSIFFINFFLFSSVQWFLDIKKETLKMAGYLTLIIVSPWLMHFLGESAGIKPSFIDIFKAQFVRLGLSPSSDYQLLAELSFILLIGSSIMLGFWVIMFTVPSVLLFWSIKMINKTSIILVGIARQKVQLFFVAVNILVPIWFFIKDRFS